MAILACREVYESRQGTADRHQGRTHVRVFRVLTDAPHVGDADVRAAPGLVLGQHYDNGLAPMYGQPLVALTEYDLYSFAASFDALCTDEDGMGWILRVTYAPFDVQEADASPLSVPAELSWDFDPFEEVCYQDISSNPIVNAAGDYFDPPVTREQATPVLTIVRNEATFDPTLAYTYANKVNSNTPFYGMGARQVKMAPTTGHRQYHSLYGYYWQVTYKLHFDPRSFDKVILNHGLREKVGATRKNILDSTGAQITSPVPLSSTGAALAPGAAVNYLTFQIYSTIDMSPLALPGA